MPSIGHTRRRFAFASLYGALPLRNSDLPGADGTEHYRTAARLALPRITVVTHGDTPIRHTAALLYSVRRS